MSEMPPKLPKLTAQEKLDIIYEANMRLFLGLVATNPALTKDPNVIEVDHGPQSQSANL